MVFKALVRSDADVNPVAATGAVAVKDSLTDYDVISEQVSQADVVFNTATADDVPLNEAILRGFKKRFEEGRGVGTLIHTSGTANFTDGRTDGKYDPNARVWTVRHRTPNQPSVLAEPCSRILKRILGRFHSTFFMVMWTYR